MLFKDVDVESHANVDIYLSSCCSWCRTLFRRSLVTASETAIRVAVTPDREQEFVVVERSFCFVQEKTHLFCEWLFTEKHVKVDCAQCTCQDNIGPGGVCQPVFICIEANKQWDLLWRNQTCWCSHIFDHYPHLFDGCRQVCRLGWPMQEEPDKIGPDVEIDICRFEGDKHFIMFW